MGSVVYHQNTQNYHFNIYIKWAENALKNYIIDWIPVIESDANRKQVCEEYRLIISSFTISMNSCFSFDLTCLIYSLRGTNRMQNVKGKLTKGGRCISFAPNFRRIAMICKITSFSVVVFFSFVSLLNVSLPSAFEVVLHRLLCCANLQCIHCIWWGIKYEYHNESMLYYIQDQD